MFREFPALHGTQLNFEMEKMTMKNFKKTVGYSVSTFVVLVLLFNSSAKAQAPTYGPGQTIRISVTFEGPDAGKISAVMMSLSIPSPSLSQPGFKTDIFPGDSKQTGPNTFEVSYKIPENQASGDYPLGQLRAVIDRDAPITLFYNAPTDFPVRNFKIDNHKTMVKPTIKDVKELP